MLFVKYNVQLISMKNWIWIRNYFLIKCINDVFYNLIILDVELFFIINYVIIFLIFVGKGNYKIEFSLATFSKMFTTWSITNTGVFNLFLVATNVCLVSPFVQYQIVCLLSVSLSFFSRITGPISTKLCTKHP